jgi:nucleoside-diphosphate-sugar epimerase
VAAFCKQAMAGEPLIVYGDGRQTRDFVFVEDLSRGIAAALTHGGEGVFAHIGSGTETTILEVARMVADRLGGATVEHRPERVGDVLRSTSDISRARELFDFEPQVALAEGLDRTVRWFQESGG